MFTRHRGEAQAKSQVCDSILEGKWNQDHPVVKLNRHVGSPHPTSPTTTFTGKAFNLTFS